MPADGQLMGELGKDSSLRIVSNGQESRRSFIQLKRLLAAAVTGLGGMMIAGV
jgi:hypothetical protein